MSDPNFHWDYNWDTFFAVSPSSDKSHIGMRQRYSKTDNVWTKVILWDAPSGVKNCPTCFLGCTSWARERNTGQK